MARPYQILVLHGPNLNLLGRREPGTYGMVTLSEINSRLQAFAGERSVELRIIQANGEGALIDALHDAMDWADGVLINPCWIYAYQRSAAGCGGGVSTFQPSRSIFPTCTRVKPSATPLWLPPSV